MQASGKALKHSALAIAALFSIANCAGQAVPEFGPGPDSPRRAQHFPAPGPIARVQDPLPVVPARRPASGKLQRVDVRRIDPPRPGGISVEPVLAGFSDGERDHLIAGWHHMSPGPVRDQLALGAAISRDSGSTWTNRVYTSVPPLGAVHFDPYAAADAASQTLWLGSLTRGLPGSAGTPGSLLVAVQSGSALGEARVLDQQYDDKPAMSFWRQGARSELLIAATHGFRVSTDLGQSFEGLGGAPMDPRVGGYSPVHFADGEWVALGVRASTDTTEGFRLVLRRKRPAASSVDDEEAVRPLNFLVQQTLDNAVPGRFRLPPFGQLARDARGELFYVYNDVRGTPGQESNVDVLLIRSSDRGRTWSAPQVVNGDNADPRDQFMPAIAIDADGRLHALYFDTRRSSQPDASGTAFLDVVYALSTDRGQSFAEQFLTAAPFDASPLSWRPFSNEQPAAFVGDYLALHAGQFGVYAAYPEAAGDQVALKLARIAPQDFSITSAISGAWYDPDQNGHGLMVEVLADHRLLALWFTFDRDGRQSWFGGVGTYSGNTAVIANATRSQGGRWIPDFNPAAVQQLPWGSLRIEFTDCNHGRIDFQSRDPDYGSGSMPLNRLTQPAGLSCD